MPISSYNRNMLTYMFHTHATIFVFYSTESKYKLYNYTKNES